MHEPLLFNLSVVSVQLHRKGVAKDTLAIGRNFPFAKGQYTASKHLKAFSDFLMYPPGVSTDTHTRFKTQMGAIW